MQATLCGPSSSPWKPRMYAAVSRPTSAPSSPKVPPARAQRGSVAMSAIGCRATWMPTARYSRRAMSPKRRTTSSSPIAPKPIGSGHCENEPADQLVAGFSSNPWRGSEEIVTGMPSRVPAAISWSRLCHSARRLAAGAK